LSTGRSTAPAIVWLGVAAVALLASLVIEDAAVPIAAGGAVIALTLIGAPIPVRILTALAMLPIALLDSTPTWAWFAGMAALALAGGLFPRPAHVEAEVNGDLQRHLAWCRRREEPAHLLLMPLDTTSDTELAYLLESFRITDSVTLGRGANGSELYALLDAFGFERQGLERRLAGRLDGRSFGWASFPEDGVTLQTLVEHARTVMLDVHLGLNGQVGEEAPAPLPARSLEHATGRS